MTDAQLRLAERAWRAAPESETAVSDALLAFDRAGEDPPWELLSRSPRWQEIVTFLRRWFAKPPGPEDGCTVEELTAAEDELGTPLPRPLREWFLLLGQHPDLPYRGRSRTFGDLLPLNQLKADAQGWVDLAYGHQGNGTWGLRLADPAGQVHAYHGFWQAEGALDLVGNLERFLLSWLVDEFTWNGARGAAPGVHHAVYWDLEACLAAARSNYTRRPMASLYACGDEDTPRPLVYQDEETLINLNDPEPVYVLARTEAAWERALASFGSNYDE